MAACREDHRKMNTACATARCPGVLAEPIKRPAKEKENEEKRKEDE